MLFISSLIDYLSKNQFFEKVSGGFCNLFQLNAQNICQKKPFYVDVNAFLPQNLMILKADISKTSTGRYLFLFIFMCGNSNCTRIQKIKNFSGGVNWVHQALRR